MKYKPLILAFLVCSHVYILINSGSNHQNRTQDTVAFREEVLDTKEKVIIKKKTLLFISELASYARNDDWDSYVGTLEEISSYLGGLSNDGQFYFREVLSEVPDNEQDVIEEYESNYSEIIYEFMGGDLISDIILLHL